MAERYGGKYSPGGRSGQDRSGQNGRGARTSRRGAKIEPGGARVNLLYLPAVLLFATTLWSGPVVLAWGIGGAAAWAGAAQLTREGLRAEQEFLSRKLARKPALPRKMLGSLLLGLGTGFAAMAHETGPLGAVIYGGLAALLHFAAFGPDPLRNRATPEGLDQYQQDRVAQVVERAEVELGAMTRAIQRLNDRVLAHRVSEFEETARAMITRVEEDPRDLLQARKYLGVYLTGAREASEKFAEHYRQTHSPEARGQYEALLHDLQENFAAKTEKMLQDDATDMTIEIEVLRDRLRREGVRASVPGTDRDDDGINTAQAPQHSNSGS